MANTAKISIPWVENPKYFETAANSWLNHITDNSGQLRSAEYRDGGP